jgi:hypothetical protein
MRSGERGRRGRRRDREDGSIRGRKSTEKNFAYERTLKEYFFFGGFGVPGSGVQT